MPIVATPACCMMQSRASRKIGTQRSLTAVRLRDCRPPPLIRSTLRIHSETGAYTDWCIPTPPSRIARTQTEHNTQLCCCAVSTVRPQLAQTTGHSALCIHDNARVGAAVSLPCHTDTRCSRCKYHLLRVVLESHPRACVVAVRCDKNSYK